jgi:hypothetical protein
MFAFLSGLAAFGALYKGEYWWLLFLASPVYCSAIWYVQWALAILALVYLAHSQRVSALAGHKMVRLRWIWGKKIRG